MAASMSGVGKPSAERASLNTTSFQKKSRSKLISIPGSRPSVQNGQLLVSTGVTSLDYLLGQFAVVRHPALTLPTQPGDAAQCFRTGVANIGHVLFLHFS